MTGFIADDPRSPHLPVPLRIRPLVAGEERLVQALFSHLSRRTRELRFCIAPRELSATMLACLVCVDERHLALLAESCVDGRHEVVALANVAVAADGAAAEVALVVRDEWQRRGIGTALLQAIVEWSAGRGVRRLLAHIAPDNVGVLALVRRLATVIGVRWMGGTAELTCEVAVGPWSEVQSTRVL